MAPSRLLNSLWIKPSSNSIPTKGNPIKKSSRIGKAVDAVKQAKSSCPNLIRKQALRRTTYESPPYEISIDPKRISIPVCVLQMKWLRERSTRAMKNFESRSSPPSFNDSQERAFCHSLSLKEKKSLLLARAHSIPQVSATASSNSIAIAVDSIAVFYPRAPGPIRVISFTGYSPSTGEIGFMPILFPRRPSNLRDYSCAARGVVGLIHFPKLEILD